MIRTKDANLSPIQIDDTISNRMRNLKGQASSQSINKGIYGTKNQANKNISGNNSPMHKPMSPSVKIKRLASGLN
jgi:hypothetical protein